MHRLQEHEISIMSNYHPRGETITRNMLSRAYSTAFESHRVRISDDSKSLLTIGPPDSASYFASVGGQSRLRHPHRDVCVPDRAIKFYYPSAHNYAIIRVYEYLALENRRMHD